VEEEKKIEEKPEKTFEPLKEEEKENITQFNAEEEVNALKENITSFEQRLTSIEEALDKFAEEEEVEEPIKEQEETFEKEDEIPVKPETEEPVKEEEKKEGMEAKYSKDMKALLNKISNLETQLAKFGNSGMKRTSQSGINATGGVDNELEAYNKRKGYY
jgi:chromosome segregation ATPase